MWFRNLLTYVQGARGLVRFPSFGSEIMTKDHRVTAFALKAHRLRETVSAALLTRRIRFAMAGSILGACLLLPVIGRIAHAEEGVLVDRIVAEVNNDIITLYDLNRKAAPFVKRVKSMARPIEEERRMIYELREKVLDQMVDETLTDQEIKRYNITVSEEAIDSTVEEMKKRTYMTDQQLRERLEKEGLTMDEYRTQMKNQILRMRLVNREVKSKIVITDEDIRAYYDQHRDRYVGVGKVHLRQILLTVPPKASDDEKKAVRQKLEAIRQQVTGGASFEELARTTSQSPLAKEGGDLGTLAMSDLAPSILQALSGLKAGDVSPVVENDQGMQLFYVEALEEGQSKSLEDVSAEIENILYDEVVNQKFMSWLKDLRERSHIKIIR
jgi:peptidyl-prolyl cis-trans isomerase SurA